MDDLDMRELLDEESYWRRLEAEAISRGTTGETFARCIASVRAEIDYRERTCGCE